MKFPEITDIAQVREAIRGRSEFIEAQRECYTVFNYMVAHADSFDCPIRRECRGLIFDERGEVMSRRFHKFFNLDEKPETMHSNVNWMAMHHVLHKLDGSMITPLVFPDCVYWATKMGITDIGRQAGAFVERVETEQPDEYKGYTQLAKALYHDNLTPIFEYMGPGNRIVISYEHENMTLLAVRHNVTGEYKSFAYLEDIANEFDVPVVRPYEGSISNMRDKTDIEGVVVRFTDGHMIKVKTDWYCAIHKAKEHLLFEKNVLKMILEDKLDDVIPHLMEDDRKRIEDYKTKVLTRVNSIETSIRLCMTVTRHDGVSRKDFALTTNHTKFMKTLMFVCWDKKDTEIREEVIRALLKHVGSQSEVDGIREYIGAKWEPTVMGELKDAA
jgi:RNA ligase